METSSARILTPDTPASCPGLLDPQGRRLDYLRVAITDRCNLRCRYCMPAGGIALEDRADLLNLEELSRICGVFTRLGVRKIRITGGEPLTRKGVGEFLRQLSGLPGPPEILITTNGTLLSESLPDLIAAGIRRINLSLDTLDPETWRTITRRDGFEKVLSAIDQVIDTGLGLKINMVVQPGVNDHEFDDFVRLTLDRPLTVRFIEPMPFSGSGGEAIAPVSGAEILRRIRSSFPLTELPRPHAAVDRLFAIDGHAGQVGIIEGHSRNFCADCSRLRLDPRGQLRTCLYGTGVADLRSIVRSGGSDREIEAAITDAVRRRLEDGHAAQAVHAGRESMARIGG